MFDLLEMLSDFCLKYFKAALPPSIATSLPSEISSTIGGEKSFFFLIMSNSLFKKVINLSISLFLLSLPKMA